MKLLAFADMHGSMKALKSITSLAKTKRPDYILCAGDFTVFEQNIVGILKSLDQLRIPVLMIPGNHETGDRLKELCKKHRYIIYLNKGVLETKDAVFIGNEGNGFSIDDPKFRKWGIDVLKDLRTRDFGNKKIVLMTHAPPYGTNTDRILEDHCGNKAVREFIEKLQPDIAVCGHLHECSGKTDHLKKTRIINPGPYGKIIQLG